MTSIPRRHAPGRPPPSSPGPGSWRSPTPATSGSSPTAPRWPPSWSSSSPTSDGAAPSTAVRPQSGARGSRDIRSYSRVWSMSACFRAIDSWVANRQKAAPHRPQPMIASQPRPPTTTSSPLGSTEPIDRQPIPRGRRRPATNGTRSPAVGRRRSSIRPVHPRPSATTGPVLPAGPRSSPRTVEGPDQPFSGVARGQYLPGFVADEAEAQLGRYGGAGPIGPVHLDLDPDDPLEGGERRLAP